MDVFLLIVVIIMAIAAIGINTYIIIHLSHPEDTGFAGSWFPRIIIILSLTIGATQVLALPLDVANAKGDGGGFDMGVFWYLLYFVVLADIGILIPTALFLYESDEEDKLIVRIWSTIWRVIIFMILLVAISVIGVFFWDKAEVPINTIQCDYSRIVVSSTATVSTMSDSCTVDKDALLHMNVTPPIAIIGLYCWIGWWLLVVYLGIGMASLPLDLFKQWKDRPKKLSKADFEDGRKKLLVVIMEMLNIGQVLKDQKADARKRSGGILCFGIFNVVSGFTKNVAVDSKIRNFEVAVNQVENDLSHLQSGAQYNKRVEPLWFLAKLIGALLLAVLTLLWVVHIIVYLLARTNGIPAYAFFNTILTYIEGSDFAFFATLLYCGFTFYLYWAAIHGNMQIGMNILFISFYPIKANGTFMNSLLVNSLLINLWSISLTFFLTRCFEDYARLTAIDMIMGIQICSLSWFRFFFQYNIFIYILFIFLLGSTIYMFFKPVSKFDYAKLAPKKQAKKLREALLK